MVAEANTQSAQAANQKVLDRLARVVRRADDFVLGFVKCNHLPQQEEMRQAFLTRLDGKRVLEIELDQDKPIVSLLGEITPLWDDADPPDVVCVYGLRHSIQAEDSPVLGRLNNDRELIRRAVPVPLLIWLPDYALDLVARGAPDFWAWRSGVYEFQTEKALWEMDCRFATAAHAYPLASLSLEEKRAEIERLEELLRTAESLPEKKAREQAIISALLFKLGSMYHDLNEWGKARLRFIESLKLYQLLNNKTGIAAALGSLGNIALVWGDHEAARALYEEGLAISREIGNMANTVAALTCLGHIASDQGNYAAARTLYKEGLVIRRETRDKTGVAATLINLGLIAFAQQDHKAARSLYEEGLAISRETGDKESIAVALGNLGNAAIARGDHEATQSLYQESIAIFREIGDMGNAAAVLINLGLLQKNQRDYQEALYAFVAAREVFQELHMVDRIMHSQRNIQNIREQVGEEQFQTWLREKHGKKVAHRITESLDKEAAQLRVAA